MNFEQRKQSAMDLVCEFLEAYSPPRGLTEDQMSTRITSVADAFARRMPSKGDYAESVRKVLDKLRDTHLSNSWPPQGAFVVAMPQNENYRPGKTETYQTDEMERAAKAMTEGWPVADRYVWGRESQALVQQGKVGRDRLEEYRRASIKSFSEIYRHSAEEVMRSRVGSVVSPYFQGEGVA